MTAISYQLGEQIPEKIATIVKPYMNVIVESLDEVQPINRFKEVPKNTLKSQNNVLLAIGKNALIQVKEFEDLLDFKPNLVIVHQVKGYEPHINVKDDWTIRTVNHPLPNEITFKSTLETIANLKKCKNNNTLHVLISGGGSAAFAIPEDDISSNQYLEITERAIASGFQINELNYIRSLIDKVKGGKLLEQFNFSHIYSWVTSDVISDDPNVIASGPTSPGISGSKELDNWMSKILKNLGINVAVKNLKDKLINASNFYLTRKNKSNLKILTTRNDLIRSLEIKLNSMGKETMIADVNLSSDIEEVSNDMTQLIERFSSQSDRTILWSGEPSIAITSDALLKGKGGRISALSCLIAESIKDHKNILFLGIATDGVDGSSPCGGYIITSNTEAHLRPLGGARLLIRKGNSGMALNSLGYGINIDQTNINLLDIYLTIIL